MADSLFTPTEVTADLGQLQKLLKRIATEWEMFLSQAVRWPPHQRQAEIEAIIRHYTKAPPRRTADRFRFNTLVHRYRTNSERWARRLRAAEESGGLSRSAAARREQRRAAEDPSAPQTLAQVTTRAGRASGEQMRDLYRAFRDARRARGHAVSSLGYREFAQRLGAHLKQARERAGRNDLLLRVDEVGGKVRIAVRVLSAASQGGRE